MSERWKYQIKTAAPWGVFMIAITTFFGLKENPFMAQITDPNFTVDLLVIFYFEYLY